MYFHGAPESRNRLRAALPLALLVLALTTAACQPAATPTPQLPTQAPATPTPAPKPTVPPLTGQLTRTAIEAHSGWEQLRAQDYTPDSAAITTIRDKAGDVQVIVFLGTWCGDSKREMPRFFKIWDQAGIPMSKVSLYGLDRTKKDAEGLTVKWKIEYVPTFIFVRNGQEIGRIIEKPKGTLEGDIAQILSQR